MHLTKLLNNNKLEAVINSLFLRDLLWDPMTISPCPCLAEIFFYRRPERYRMGGDIFVKKRNRVKIMTSIETNRLGSVLPSNIDILVIIPAYLIKQVQWI